MGVSVGPGQTVLTVTLYRASSRARDLEKAFNPPRAAALIDDPEFPTFPESEPSEIIRPFFCFTIWRSTAFERCTDDINSISSIFRHPEGSWSSNNVKGSFEPQQLTAASIVPNMSITESAQRPAASMLVRST